MKKFSVITALLLFLMSAAPVLAQSEDRADRRNADERAEEERGILPALVRLLERNRNQEKRAEENTPPAAEESSNTAPAENASAASTSTTPAETPEENRAAASSVPAQSTTTRPLEAWGATTTPILNTHTEGGSGIYANEWPLSKTQSGLLFLFSIGITMAGLLLAERDSLQRLLQGRPLLTPASLSEKRTALS